MKRTVIKHHGSNKIAENGLRIVVSGIAMHHIYCDRKKEFIVERAQQLQLGGLYLYGKPGKVVVEGTLERVLQYERDLRCLRWQKIQVMAHFNSCDMSVAKGGRLFDPAGGLQECVSVVALNARLECIGLSALVNAIHQPFGAPRTI